MVARQSTYGNGAYVSHNKFALLAAKTSPSPAPAPPLAPHAHPTVSRTARKEQRKRALSSVNQTAQSLLSVDGGLKAVKKSGSAKSIGDDDDVPNGTYHAGMEFDSNGEGNGNAVVVKGMNGGVDVDGVVSEMRRRTRVIDDDKSSEKRGKKTSTAKVTVVEQTELERLGKIDWEIPRKTLHSSIGFLTLALYHLDPPTVRPLITVLSTGLAVVSVVDFFRLRYPSFARTYENLLGPLMRESEKTKLNGVIWYLIGVIFVLSVYPRDVAVISILTLSWSDTTASTVGRLLGRHSPSLPSHVPFLPFLPFSSRKSSAGFAAAALTGFLIAVAFWWNGSHDGYGPYSVLDDGVVVCGKPAGLWVSAAVLGVGGAVVEALDLGYDDNLTLPILTGALMWSWLNVASRFI